VIDYNPIIQHLKTENNYHVDMLRLDLIDTEISGNKWFKLKNNLQNARNQSHETIITFGGAFSNHIASTAAACKKFNFNAVGIIRGEETNETNPTLVQAKKNGMQLHFVSRELYSQKEEDGFKLYLEKHFGRHYLIPEGGNNSAGVLGCSEILKNEWEYDYILSACGTGATYAGLMASLKPHQIVIGISVLKGTNDLPRETEELFHCVFSKKEDKIYGNDALAGDVIKNNCICNTYAFNGYAGYHKDVIAFKASFEHTYKIPLDHVYTSKLLYALFDLMEKKKLGQEAKILVIHCGGLQGNRGFEERYHLSPSL
jgi:1-aminocyclopropane-1-carboxylate deaminase